MVDNERNTPMKDKKPCSSDQKPADRVRSDDLPEWADWEEDGSDDDEADSGGGDSSWIEEATDTEKQTGTVDPDIDNPKSERRNRPTVSVSQTECSDCGHASVKNIHPECDAPIIYISGQWQCGCCGTIIKPRGECPECGSPVDIDAVGVPLDLRVTADPEAIEQVIHEETNQRRRAEDLPPLNYSNHLSAIAFQHSRDMAQRDFFDHTNPDGDDANDRYRRFEHDTRSSGENIALQYPAITDSAREAGASVVDSWMGSKGHRENILRQQFDKEGIGIYLDPDGGVYATQNFY